MLIQDLAYCGFYRRRVEDTIIRLVTAKALPVRQRSSLVIVRLSESDERRRPLCPFAFDAELYAHAVTLGFTDPDHFVFPWHGRDEQIDPRRPMTSWRSAWRSLRSAAGLPDVRFTTEGTRNQWFNRQPKTLRLAPRAGRFANAQVSMPCGLPGPKSTEPQGASLAARGESPSAFDERCILAVCVAPPSHTGGILGRRALSARRGASCWWD